MRRLAVTLLTLSAGWATWAQSPEPIAAQASPPSRDSTERFRARSRFIRRLEQVPAPTFKEALPLRELLDRIATSADVEIVGLWKGRFDPGLDPELRIRLELRPGTSCMEALERALHEVDDGGEPVLWQATDFGLEVGPRPALWRPRAMETRVYDVTDLLLKVKSYRAAALPQGGGTQGGAAGGSAGGDGGDAGTGGTRTARVAELIELIQRCVEPEAWQPLGGPCSITPRDALLVIRAPDFVHRRIDDPAGAPPRKPRKSAAGGGK